MGDIARAWDEMSDEEKVEELRQPVITRSFSKPSRPCNLLKTFEDLVVSVRRKAMALNTLEERAELVDKTWGQLKTQFRRREVAHDFAELVRRCLYSETISWPWFGHRLDYPAGEGE
jgi:hypothetical protein